MTAGRSTAATSILARDSIAAAVLSWIGGIASAVYRLAPTESRLGSRVLPRVGALKGVARYFKIFLHHVASLNGPYIPTRFRGLDFGSVII